MATDRTAYGTLSCLTLLHELRPAITGGMDAMPPPHFPIDIGATTASDAADTIIQGLR